MAKYFNDNPYEGMSSDSKSGVGMTQVADLGQFAYDSFTVPDVNLTDSPSDTNNLFLDSSSFRENVAKAEELKKSAKGGVGRGAAKGASIGASTGNPYVAAIGAVVGAIFGGIGSGKKRRKAKKAFSKANNQYESYIGNYNSRLENLAEETSNRNKIRALNEEYSIPSSFSGL